MKGRDDMSEDGFKKLEDKLAMAIREIDIGRKKDKERWENMNWDMCQVCGTEGSDRRTLFISCFYQLKEASPKFIDLFLTEQKDMGYALRICKGCRAALLQVLGRWAQGGRLAIKNLDDQGLLSFDSKEALEEYNRRMGR